MGGEEGVRGYLFVRKEEGGQREAGDALGLTTLYGRKRWAELRGKELLLSGHKGKTCDRKAIDVSEGLTLPVTLSLTLTLTLTTLSVR